MENGLINRNRKGWIDALRGLAILLVIYGHCSQGFKEFFVVTSPVKMPLFFAISGYVINGDVTLKDFFVKLFKKVFVPWLVLGLFFPLLLIPIKGISYFIDYFLQMLSGEILWFMPCFIIAQPIHFLFRKYFKGIILIVVASVLCFIVGIMFHRHGILNYAMINTALVVQPFFMFGYIFREYEQTLVKTSWKSIAGLFVAYLLLCGLSIKLFPGQTIDVHLSHYYNVPYCMLLIALGCLILFIAARKSDFSSNLMSFIGQNTLVLYMWHGMAIMALYKILSLFGFSLAASGWIALLNLLWVVSICGVAAVIINKYVPWMVGKGPGYSRDNLIR